MKLKKLTDSEQVVMKCIWLRDEDMSLPEIVELTNTRYKKQWKPQTVSTFLKHLVQKGYLSLYRQGRIFKYQPLVKEEDYSSHLLKDHIHFWNDDSLEAFAMTLCREETITKEELSALKKMLDAFDQG